MPIYMVVMKLSFLKVEKFKDVEGKVNDKKITLLHSKNVDVKSISKINLYKVLKLAHE